uniref:Protein krueppel n=1 Tax=Anopheles christyi TaxID=43041 RepID=A0A182K6N9_9DIPT
MFSYKHTLSTENTATQLQPELHTICRTCLQQSSESRSIFDLDQSTQLTYSAKVMQCADVEIHPYDSLPSRICLQCIEDLDVACRFRANCISANLVLQTYLSYDELEEKQEATLLPTLAQATHSEPDDGEEIAIHLDSGVMYTYKPPSGLDVKLVFPSADDVISNTGNIQMETINRNDDGTQQETVALESAKMPIVQPIPVITNVEQSRNDDIEYMLEVINESEPENPTMQKDAEVTYVSNNYHGGPKRKTAASLTPDSTHVHSRGKSASSSTRTTTGMKTLQTIRKTHTPNERKPTIEAVTTQPAPDGSGVETVIRVKRNLTAPKPSLVCKLCNVTYKHKHALETHMRRHRGDRPYKCDYCDKSFVVPFELQRHMRIHTGQKPYKCQYCDRAYSDFGSKTKHERTHTGERPYACHYCDKTFSYSHVLNSHLLVHTGVKKYCCSICGKRFTKSHHLKTHYNTHPLVKTEVSNGEMTGEVTNNNIKQETTAVVYTELLQDELIASADDQRSSADGGGMLVGSYHGTGSNLIATTEWTTMVNSNGGVDGVSVSGNPTATAITPEELENVSIVSFTDYIIKSDGLDDLMVVQDSADDELVELVGQPIMDR